MTDLPNFNPSSVDELLGEIFTNVSGVAEDWWRENSGQMKGHLRVVAEAELQVREGLLRGTMTEEAADMNLESQKMLLKAIVNSTQLRKRVLAQRIVNEVFSLVGWSVFNRTGVNLFPEIVKPD
ncbi:MAG: hypothetical protein AAFX00_04255 [Pseudomonadota bacterium]